MILPDVVTVFPWVLSPGALVPILRWKKRMETATGMWLISCVVQGTPLVLFTNRGKASVHLSSESPKA